MTTVKLSKQSRRVIAIGYMDIRYASLSGEQAILSVFHPRRDTIATRDRPREEEKKNSAAELRLANAREGMRARGPVARAEPSPRCLAFYWTFRCVAHSRYQRVNVATIIELKRDGARCPVPGSHVSRVLCLSRRRDDSPRETRTPPDESCVSRGNEAITWMIHADARGNTCVPAYTECAFGGGRKKSREIMKRVVDVGLRRREVFQKFRTEGTEIQQRRGWGGTGRTIKKSPLDQPRFPLVPRDGRGRGGERSFTRGTIGRARA